MTEDNSIPLMSPGYPNPYPLDTDCSWEIHAAGTGRPVLTILDFEIYNGADFVHIKNGASAIMSLTGVNTPSSVSVNATSMTVHFDSYWDYGLRGFLFEISWSPQNSKL